MVPSFQWEKVMFCLQNKSQWFYLAHLTSMTYQVIFPKETTYNTFRKPFVSYNKKKSSILTLVL